MIYTYMALRTYGNICFKVELHYSTQESTFGLEIMLLSTVVREVDEIMGSLGT